MSSPYHSIEENILYVAEKTNTKHICVTKGNGAILHYDGKMYSNTGYEIVDTVGAGDSFLAGLLSKLRGSKPQEAIDFAVH
jgi:fructokinase